MKEVIGVRLEIELEPGIKFVGILIDSGSPGDFLVTDPLLGMIEKLVRQLFAADDIELDRVRRADGDDGVANMFLEPVRLFPAGGADEIGRNADGVFVKELGEVVVKTA